MNVCVCLLFFFFFLDKALAFVNDQLIKGTLFWGISGRCSFSQNKSKNCTLLTKCNKVQLQSASVFLKGVKHRSRHSPKILFQKNCKNYVY